MFLWRTRENLFQKPPNTPPETTKSSANIVNKGDNVACVTYSKLFDAQLCSIDTSNMQVGMSL